jgi:hypothetical protein
MGSLKENLCGQKNGRLFFRIAKKVSRMDQNFLNINIIFKIFLAKTFGGGVGNIANPTGLRISLSVENLHSVPL